MDFKDHMNWFDIYKGCQEYAVILYCWYKDKTLQEDDRGLSNKLLQPHHKRSNISTEGWDLRNS